MACINSGRRFKSLNWAVILFLVFVVARSVRRERRHRPGILPGSNLLITTGLPRCQRTATRNDMNEGYCFDDSPKLLPIRGALAGVSAQQNSPVNSPGHHSKFQNNFPGVCAPILSGTGVYHEFTRNQVTINVGNTISRRR